MDCIALMLGSHLTDRSADCKTFKIKTHTQTSQSELYLCVVYRSPNSTDDNDKLLLQFIAELCNNKLDNLMFIGDFNLRGIDWNNCSIPLRIKLKIILLTY